MQVYKTYPVGKDWGHKWVVILCYEDPSEDTMLFYKSLDDARKAAGGLAWDHRYDDVLITIAEDKLQVSIVEGSYRIEWIKDGR